MGKMPVSWWTKEEEEMVRETLRQYPEESSHKIARRLEGVIDRSKGAIQVKVNRIRREENFPQPFLSPFASRPAAQPTVSVESLSQRMSTIQGRLQGILEELTQLQEEVELYEQVINSIVQIKRMRYTVSHDGTVQEVKKD